MMNVRRLLVCMCSLMLVLTCLPSATHAAEQASTVHPTLVGEMDGFVRLKGPEKIGYITGIGSTGDTKLSLDLPVPEGESIILSYECFNYQKGNWEPRDVRIIHGPAGGFEGTLTSDFELGNFRIAISSTYENTPSGYYHAEFVAW